MQCPPKKVWDVRTFKSVQTIPLEPNWSRSQMDKAVWTPFAYVSHERALFTVNSVNKFYAVQYSSERRVTAATAASQFPISAVQYQPRDHTIFSAAGRELSIWELKHGTVEYCVPRLTGECCATHGA